MDDGTEFIAGPGDVTSLPSGHDAWVVGDEPVVVVDWFGASNYAKCARAARRGAACVPRYAGTGAGLRRSLTHRPTVHRNAARLRMPKNHSIGV